MVARLSSFFDDVRGTVLTGLSAASSALVVAADSVLAAIGKLQGQIAAETTRAVTIEGLKLNKDSPAFTGDMTAQSGNLLFGVGNGLVIGLNQMFVGTANDRAAMDGANLVVKSWNGFGLSPNVAGQTIPPGLNAHWFDCRAGAASHHGPLSVRGEARLNSARVSTLGTTTTLDTLGSVAVVPFNQPVSGGSGAVPAERFYDQYNNIYTAFAVAGGVVTGITLAATFPLFGTPPANPVALTSIGGAATGVTVNLNWTQSTILSLNPSGPTQVNTITFPDQIGTKITLYSTYGIGINSGEVVVFSSGDFKFRASYAGAIYAQITSTGLNATPIGTTTPAAGKFTTIEAAANPTKALQLTTKQYVDAQRDAMWKSGTGVPTITMPVGGMWSRTDGPIGATLYVSRGAGVWNAVAGV